jgi:transposase InsO family protein
MRLLSHRRKSKAPVHREKPRLKASGPNQVLSWDITYLKSPISGIYFYLYLVIDIWSRKIVAWEIHERESADYAAAMLRTLDCKQSLRGIKLHSDNGSPMKGLSMLAMMQQLGVEPSHSRPRVSTDNPYSESLFGTLKYQASYPSFFESLDEARAWVEKFVDYYNNRHLHSGIGYVTPEDRHTGRDVQILETRRKTYEEARRKHPERWSGKPKSWERKEYVYINPIVEDVEEKAA